MAVQRIIQTEFRKDQPVRNSIKEWYEKLQRHRCLCIAKLPGPSGPSEEKVESVGEARSPLRMTNRASRELGSPKRTLRRIHCKPLQVKPHRLQLMKAVNHDDRTHSLLFCTEMQKHLEADGFAENLFSATKLHLTFMGM